jgi:hypothetical protein
MGMGDLYVQDSHTDASIFCWQICHSDLSTRERRTMDTAKISPYLCIAFFFTSSKDYRMKIKSFLPIVLLASFVGCAKHEEDPWAPIVNYYKSLNAGDSAGIVDCFESPMREFYINNKDTDGGIRGLLKQWNGIHAEVKIKGVKIDTLSSNLAKVYIKLTLSGKTTGTLDSVYLFVFKQYGSWKMREVIPLRDSRHH